MGKPINNIQLITENDLCISCGACKHACPYEVVNIQMNVRKGFYEPEVTDLSACSNCQTRECLKVCPSYEEDFVQLAGWTNPEDRIGPYHAIYTGYSTSDKIRIRASSGGIIKELCRYYLESDRVDAVITLRQKDGLDYEPDIYTSVEDVLHTDGSIYHNINFENCIELLKKTSGRLLLVATPCQLTSIRKWQLACPDQLRGTIETTIGLICGWMFSRHSLDHFSRAMGVDHTDIKTTTYRGGDQVGNLVIKTTKNLHTFTRRPIYLNHKHTAPFKVAFSRTYNSKRCLLCVEHLNYLADIAVGDAWLQAFKEDRIGTSIVITRNRPADVVIENLISLGRIELTRATENDVIESQSEDLAFGISAQQMINKLKSRASFAPTYTLPRPEQDMPTIMTWFRDYLNPLFVRYMTRKGYGYFWYQLRVLYFHLSSWGPLLLRAGKKLLRILKGLRTSALGTRA